MFEHLSSRVRSASCSIFTLAKKSFSFKRTTLVKTCLLFVADCSTLLERRPGGFNTVYAQWRMLRTAKDTANNSNAQTRPAKVDRCLPTSVIKVTSIKEVQKIRI